MANRAHGSHECYCPSCNYRQMVDAYSKCNTLTCPDCGDRLRATETGEYRRTGYGQSQISQDEGDGLVAIFKTLGLAVVTGLGIGIGLYIVRKKMRLE